MSYESNSADTDDRLADVQNPRSLPFGLFGKSPFIRGMIVAVLDKSQQQIADDTKELAKVALMCVGVWWANAAILFPQVTGMALDGVLMLKMLNPVFLAFAGLVGTLAIVHAVWYAGVRWRGTRRVTGGGSK